MRECSICRSLTKDNFDQETSVFTSRRAVLYFLVNTLLTIKKYRDHLCYCSQREQKCAIFDIIWHINEFYGVASLDVYYTFIRILILLIKKTPDQAKIAFFSLACFRDFKFFLFFLIA